MDTTIDTNHGSDTSVDKLMSMVDLPTAQPQPDDELPAWIKAHCNEAAKTAYFKARADSKSKDEAAQAAQAAYEAKANELLAQASQPAPTQAPGAGSNGAIKAPPPAGMPEPTKAPKRPRTPRPQPATAIAGGQHDQVGADRSAEDRAALIAAGFAPKEPIYRAGTRVIEWGVDNARKSRLEHDAKPSVQAACDKLGEKIAAENRRFIECLATDLTMNDAGRIAIPGHDPLEITYDAFRGLTTRLGYGGANYLSRCPAALRAHNFNDWQTRVDAEQKLALRVRDRAADEKAQIPAGVEIFAAVSPGYAAFDANMIAEAVAKASPEGAKGSFAYDGTRSRFEVHFHSNVQPQHYVAGEFFKAGCLVSTDDTGGGSIVVRSMAWQNLCLNLIIIDRCAREIARIKHVGSVLELAQRLEAAYRQALASLDHFLKVWDYACADDVAIASKAVHAEVPSDPAKALPGIFRGVLDAGIIKLPRAGSFKAREDAIATLCALFEDDRSGARLMHGVSRAAIANAFTAFARDLDAEDPWAADEIQRAAGALLWGGRRGDQKPSPLPYLDLETAQAKDSAALTARA
jgi:hypothetical protein